MINLKFDTKELMNTLNNTVSYSSGFADGVEMQKIIFYKDLANFIEEGLKKYIDAKARGNPESLHHVYEWGAVGSPNGRLYKFTSSYTNNSITLSGLFLPSRSISQGSNEPFVNKAEIMENKIEITVEPKNSDVLSFEDNGEVFFTKKSITISNPGGNAVAGSFEKVVSEFFDSYLTNVLLRSSGIIQKLENAKEYSNRFSQGVKVGRTAGILAGKEYLRLDGITLQ